MLVPSTVYLLQRALLPLHNSCSWHCLQGPYRVLRLMYTCHSISTQPEHYSKIVKRKIIYCARSTISCFRPVRGDTNLVVILRSWAVIISKTTTSANVSSVYNCTKSSNKTTIHASIAMLCACRTDRYTAVRAHTLHKQPRLPRVVDAVNVMYFDRFSFHKENLKRF